MHLFVPFQQLLKGPVDVLLCERVNDLRHSLFHLLNCLIMTASELKRFCRKRPALFKSGQWHFHQKNTPFHNSILVTDYLTKMGIKTLPQPPYSPDLAGCDFWLFPKLRGCRYEKNEETKEAVTKVIDTLTQEDFLGAFQKLLERCNKCITAGGDYFEGD